MVPHFTGRIVNWDAERGFGWIESDGQRIFLHWRSFVERRKRPEVGDLIRFAAGKGPTGELCAQNAVHLNVTPRLSFFALSLLAALLILPSLAIARLPIDLRIAGGYAAAVSLMAYCTYASDKRRARHKEWRVREATLHFLELIGGWPGAFIAQRRLRHKCSKTSYQIVFWAIALLYQLAALDLVQGGRLSNALREFSAPPAAKPSLTPGRRRNNLEPAKDR